MDYAKPPGSTGFRAVFCSRSSPFHARIYAAQTVIDALAEIEPFTCTAPDVLMDAPLFQRHCAGAMYLGRFPSTSVQSVVVPEETAAVFFTVSRTIATLPHQAYCAVVIEHPEAAVAISETVSVDPVSACPDPPRVTGMTCASVSVFE